MQAVALPPPPLALLLLLGLPPPTLLLLALPPPTLLLLALPPPTLLLLVLLALLALLVVSSSPHARAATLAPPPIRMSLRVMFLCVMVKLSSNGDLAHAAGRRAMGMRGWGIHGR